MRQPVPKDWRWFSSMFKFCMDITHQYSIYPPKAKSNDIWHLAFGIVILFLNQEVIVAAWPVSQEVQARNLLNTGSPFPRGSKLHILGMSRVTNCAVFWTLLKRGSNPCSNQKLSISPEVESCTSYLVICPVFPCFWSKVWFYKWDGDGFQTLPKALRDVCMRK